MRILGGVGTLDVRSSLADQPYMSTLHALLRRTIMDRSLSSIPISRLEEFVCATPLVTLSLSILHSSVSESGSGAMD